MMVMTDRVQTSFDSLGFKRLKKLQHEGRYGQSMPSECCRNDERNREINHTSNCEGVPGNVVKERYVRGNLPISIKYKKLGNKEATIRQREHHSNDGFKHELGECTREPPPSEIGPKRIKVRGPKYIGSESRLDRS